MNIDRREFFKITGMTAAGVLLAANAEHQAAQSGAQVAEASHWTPAGQIDTEFGFIKGVATSTNVDYRGDLNFSHPYGDVLSAFLDTKMRNIRTSAGGAPLKQVTNAGRFTPDMEQMYTIGRIITDAASEKTPSVNMTVPPRTAIFLSCGEVDEMVLHAVHGGGDIHLFAKQIDELPGVSVKDPHDMTIVAFMEDDPDLTLTGFRPERNRLDHFNAPTGKMNPNQLLDMIKISEGNYRKDIVFINVEEGAWAYFRMIVGQKGSAERAALDWTKAQYMGSNLR